MKTVSLAATVELFANNHLLITNKLYMIGLHKLIMYVTRSICTRVVGAHPLPAAPPPNFAIFNARNVGKINLVTVDSPTAGSQNTHTFP